MLLSRAGVTVSVDVVFVVSDGTGETAQKVVQAALRQFDDHEVNTKVFPLIKEASHLEPILLEALHAGALVVTTLVERDMREATRRLAAEVGVRHIDVLDPLLGVLEDFLHRQMDGVAGRMHRTDARYYRRIEAIEFTVRADDGKDPRMLRDADVILVGPSRTGKTPLSTFLGHKGYKVGNQPVVLDMPVPEQLFDVDPRRVFALTIEPSALQSIRRARLAAMGMSETINYSDMGYIMAELEYAERICRGNRWAVVDVTHKAIEETAATILRLLQTSGLVAPPDEVSQL